MKQKEEKDMTVRELAEVMASSFNKLQSHTDQRFNRLESDVSGLKSDVSSLKTDMTAVKSDVSGLKSDNNSLKSDVRSLRADMLEVKMVQRQHSKVLDEHTAILHQVQGDVKMLVHDDMNHERRIKRLEKAVKPA